MFLLTSITDIWNYENFNYWRMRICRIKLSGFIQTKLYNYGQPRVGDLKYADFVNTVISEYYRATHNKDIVPHVPPIEGFGYQHSCREIFEDINGKLTTCSEVNCEDSKCADQYSLIQTNTDDHSVYLGHPLYCEDSTV